MYSHWLIHMYDYWKKMDMIDSSRPQHPLTSRAEQQGEMNRPGPKAFSPCCLLSAHRGTERMRGGSGSNNKRSEAAHRNRAPGVDGRTCAWCSGELRWAQVSSGTVMVQKNPACSQQLQSPPSRTLIFCFFNKPFSSNYCCLLASMSEFVFFKHNSINEGIINNREAERRHPGQQPAVKHMMKNVFINYTSKSCFY